MTFKTKIVTDGDDAKHEQQLFATVDELHDGSGWLVVVLGESWKASVWFGKDEYTRADAENYANSFNEVWVLAECIAEKVSN